MKEEWKRIEGYDNYLISNHGRVYSKHLEGCKQLSISTDGYARVNLNQDGVKKTFLIHRLVAEAFIPNPECYDTVDHIIHVSQGGTNRVDNLRWMSNQENSKRQVSTGKGIIQYTLSGEFVAEHQSIRGAARAIGMAESGIRAVLNGKQKTCGGFRWERA